MRNEIMEFDAAVAAAVSVAGKTEREGPLGDRFDMWDNDDLFGESTWEKAESELQRRAFTLALKKSGLKPEDIGALFAGDLLNQCVGSAYGLVDFDVPYFGLYGACSTAAEGILLAAALTGTETAGDVAAVVTSSHYCSAERQYRTPLEYGAQRTPTAQRTVTGSGAFIISRTGRVKIADGMGGITVDKGVSDAADMGAAMAPAALSTLLRYFAASGTRPGDYDLIVTGDLGFEGGAILCELAAVEGYRLDGVYNDCGMMIYDRKRQDVHAGGSGCGCSAVVLAASVLPMIERGELSDVLFIGTGAMMSPASIQQGYSIPAVAHLVHFKRNGR